MQDKDKQYDWLGNEYTTDNKEKNETSPIKSSKNDYSSSNNWDNNDQIYTSIFDLARNFIDVLKKGLLNIKDNAHVQEILNSKELMDFQKNFQYKYLPSIKAHFGKFKKTIPEEHKLIILIDIVGFSKGNNEHQVTNIYLFQSYLMKMKFISNHIMHNGIPITSFIPTGDGCYIIVNECKPEFAVDFLVSLISGYRSIQQTDNNQEPLALRVSALFGICVPFMDITMHQNYIGTGMNEASRVLSYGQNSLEEKFIRNGIPIETAKSNSRNSLYVDDSLKDAVIKYSNNNNKEIDYFPNVPDKHGRKRNITILEDI